MAPRITEDESLGTINEVVKKLNQIDKSWTDISNPVLKSCEETLKIAALDKTPGSNICHATLGLIIQALAHTGDITIEKVKNMVEINFDSKPYFSIKGEAKIIVDAGISLAEWFKSFIEGMLKIPAVRTPLMSIPTEASAAAAKVKEEFAKLIGFDLIRKVKKVATVCKQIKALVESIIKEFDALIKQFAALKELF